MISNKECQARIMKALAEGPALGFSAIGLAEEIDAPYKQVWRMLYRLGRHGVKRCKIKPEEQGWFGTARYRWTLASTL